MSAPAVTVRRDPTVLKPVRGVRNGMFRDATVHLQGAVMTAPLQRT